jgi:hypothetical protein
MFLVHLLSLGLAEEHVGREGGLGALRLEL